MEPLSRSELFDRLRRRWDRYEFRVSAELRWNSTTRWGRVTNISRGGTFIEISEPPRVGTHFSIQLALNTPLSLTGIVRRIDADRGMGASIFVADEEKKRFEALLVAIGEGADPVSTGVKRPAPNRPRALAAIVGR
jgi:PilZ domain